MISTTNIDYSQIFDKNLQQFNKSFEDADNRFEEILDKQTKSMNENAQIFSANIELNVGAENMGITPYEQVDSSGIQENKTRSLSAVEKTAGDFGRAFENSINSVNNSQIEAERAAEIMASGGDISAHEVMIAAEKASLTMQMALQTRNKIISAYNEIKEIRL
jgi:flagellar hook-basal body complex protein FliE